MVMLVFGKDWREIRRNWQILFPIVAVPFMISVLLPTLIIVTPSLSSISGPPMADSTSMMRNLPNQVREELAGMNAWQALVYVMSLYFFAPFFLIIPLMASSVIASDSFAGEKERKTIEAILATPISDSELLLGKMLVSFLPSMIVTAASFAIYSTIIDAFSYTLFDGRLLLPNPVWLMLIFGVAPTIALAGIGLTVMISARVKGFREAQQISSILLFPILMLVLGQISGAIFVGPTVVAVLIAAFIIVDLIVFYVGLRSFKREEILPKLS
jgi:ABC-type transport system involved in multi-copper enzyme maturation permease subunit